MYEIVWFPVEASHEVSCTLHRRSIIHSLIRETLLLVKDARGRPREALRLRLYGLLYYSQLLTRRQNLIDKIIGVIKLIVFFIVNDVTL